MKNIILIVIAVIIIGALGYFFLKPEGSAEAPSVQTQEQEDVSAGMGKINIDEVCQGALAYMSFPDGASADAFVESCKNGEQPQVIERYKQDMGLGAGAEI